MLYISEHGISAHLRTSAKALFKSGVLAFFGLVLGLAVVLLPPSVPAAIIGIGLLLLFWVMPDLQQVPIRATKAMLYPFIFSIISIPFYLALVFPGLPWLSLKRTILIVFVALFALSFSGSSKIRQNVTSTLTSSKWISYFTLAYIGTQLIATILSRNPIVSINEFINFTLSWYIPFFATLVCIRDRKQFSTLFMIAGVGVACDLVIGIIEFRAQKPFLMSLLPPSMQAQMIADNPTLVNVLYGNQTLRNGMYRAISVFNTSLSWGEMGAMLAPIACYFIAHGSRVTIRTSGALMLAACSLSIFLSGARGAYVALIVALITFLLTWAFRQLRSDPKSLKGTIMLILFAMLSLGTIGAVFFVGPVRAYVLGNGAANSSSEARSQQWALATPKIMASPIIGYGPGQAANIVGWTSPGGGSSLDSYPINLLISSGIPGLVCFFGMLLSTIAVSIRRYLVGIHKEDEFLAAIASSLAGYAVYRLTLNQVENNSLMFEMVAFALAALRLSKCHEIASEPSDNMTKNESPMP